MNNRLGVAHHLLGLILASFACSALQASDSIIWLDDYQAAAEEAKSSGKLLVVNVHATWCGPCRRMEATTLKDAALARLIGESCIAVSLDADHDSATVRTLPVRAYPTQLFLTPQGRLVGKIEGYTDARSYASSLQSAIASSGLTKRNPKSQPRQPANEGGEALASAESPAPQTATAPTAQPASFDETAQTAVGGFCPVSMIERGELIAGDASVIHVHKGSRYRFVSRRERSLFVKDPARYLPAHDGRCVVSLVDDGRQNTGAIDFPALFADRVYFFSDDARRRKFLDDPERYIDAAGQVRRQAKVDRLVR